MICTAGIPAARTFTNHTAANALLAAASTIRAAPSLGTAIANQLTSICLARLCAARLARAGTGPNNTSNKQNQSSRQTIFRKHSRSPYSICIPIKFQKSNTNLISRSPSQDFALRTQDCPRLACNKCKLRGETSGFANQKAAHQTQRTSAAQGETHSHKVPVANP